MTTPAMPEPFATIHAAVAAKLLTEGITCHDHLPLELYGSPSAYLTATDAQAGSYRSDQGELLIGLIPYSLKYFVSLEGDPQVAWAQAYSGARAMYRAFAAASLGGAVRDARIDRVSFDPVEMGSNRRPMLLVEASVLIKPTQYA
jgi:hypothetical protein